MKAIDNTAAAMVEKDSSHISINDVITTIGQDSEAADPMLREYELIGAMRVCDLLSNTGLVRIPAIVYGALQSEYDRIVALGNDLAETNVGAMSGGAS